MQLKGLGDMIYSKAPGVSNVEVFVTKLSNETSLGSTYIYKVETLGSIIGYMRIFKIETLHKNKFYKLEVSSQLCDSPQTADSYFDQQWPIYEKIIKSFVFLPY